eukprot:Rmarinus@m.18543
MMNAKQLLIGGRDAAELFDLPGLVWAKSQSSKCTSCTTHCCYAVLTTASLQVTFSQSAAITVLLDGIVRVKVSQDMSGLLLFKFVVRNSNPIRISMEFNDGQHWMQMLRALSLPVSVSKGGSLLFSPNDAKPFKETDFFNVDIFCEQSKCTILRATTRAQGCDTDVAIKVANRVAVTFKELEQLQLAFSGSHNLRIVRPLGIAYLKQGRLGLVTEFMKGGSLERAMRPTCMSCNEFNAQSTSPKQCIRILPESSGDWWCVKCNRIMCSRCCSYHDVKHAVVRSHMNYDYDGVPDDCKPAFNRNDIRMVLQVLETVARAMNHLHSRKPAMVHRDIKSSNIMLNENMEGYLSDLEFARTVDADGTSQTNLGTPGWKAPEVGRGKYTEKCDVWSFGVLVSEIVLGFVPVEACDDCLFTCNLMSDAVFKCSTCNKRLCRSHVGNKCSEGNKNHTIALTKLRHRSSYLPTRSRPCAICVERIPEPGSISGNIIYLEVGCYCAESQKPICEKCHKDLGCNCKHQSWNDLETSLLEISNGCFKEVDSERPSFEEILSSIDDAMKPRNNHDDDVMAVDA